MKSYPIDISSDPIKISTPPSIGNSKPKVEVGHIDDKLRPKQTEEIVILLGGPRAGKRVVINKSRTVERYSDNCYSEYGLTSWWHTYTRNSLEEKELHYGYTEFHKFTAYANMNNIELRAVETDLGFIESQVRNVGY